MGQCASPQPNKKIIHYHDRQPVDTESLRDKELPKLSFHSVLGNIKLKKYPYEKATPIFNVTGRYYFNLGQKSSEGNESIDWKICEKFDFQMTEYELRKSYLEVSLMNQNKEVVGVIKLNLFLIVTGPFHQDFAIQFKNEKYGRISFDLKISQIIELKIQSLLAEIYLIKKHPGEQFSYSIKAIVGYIGNTSQSESSYPAVVLLEKKSSINTKSIEQNAEKQSNLNKKKIQRAATKQIEMGGNLSWMKQRGELPSLITKVVASQLHNTYFQIVIWKYQGSDKQPQFFADCYVSFYKLFGTEASQEFVRNLEYQSRKIEITSKIQHYGKDFGKGKFQFKVINEPYFRQYQICVRTEVGILKTNPIFEIQESKGNEKCSQLPQLLQISSKIQQNIIVLNKLESSEGPLKDIRNCKLTVEIQLEKMFHLLEKTSLPPLFLYLYSSQKELLKGQKILVELGMKITQYFQIEDPVINDDCWLILISLIKRAELNLSNMGFNQKQKKLILKDKIDKTLQEKLKIAGIYKLFLYKLLGLSLNSLIRKGSEYQRTFAEIFSAYAYFRIPQFRKELLSLITSDKDPEISQWRGVQFNLTDDITQKKTRDNANIFSEMFDWEQHFYKWLVKDQQLQNQNISLNDILSQQTWRERFSKRGQAFFYFIKYWVTYIDNNVLDKKDIQWRYFPGYNRLLKGFFAEMKLRSILQYPDSLVQTSHKLLINGKLINPLMKIMINKVNIYDTSAVIRLIDYLNLIFKAFTDRNKSLPISFNYSYFFKGLKIILESQFSLGICTTLTLIYNHFSLFHVQFKRSISMYFLGRNFWNLFLNWSNNVRNIFYHLLTYKIYSQANHYSDESHCNKFSIADTDIVTRFDELMKILDKKLEIYEQQKYSYFQNSIFDKELYKRMKLKAYQKIKKKQREKHQLSNEFINITKAQSKANEQKSMLQIKAEAKFELTSKKLFTEKQYSSQVFINVKINSQDKQNKKLLEESKKYKASDFPFYDEINHPNIVFQRIIPEKLFEIQEISDEKVKYIPVCLPQFKKIQKMFICCMEKDDKTCPIIKYEISIDNRQIRPQKINDW